METEIQGLLLEFVAREWRSLPADMQPWGMWITLHPPLPDEADSLDLRESRASRAWFLDGQGVRPRGVAEWERFLVAQFLQPWCKRPHGEPVYTIGSRIYPIGTAAFAAYSGTADVYLEIVFGPLFGRGYRLTADEGEIRLERELWRS